MDVPLPRVRTALATLALAAVLAGCSAPSAGPAPTQRPTGASPAASDAPAAEAPSPAPSRSAPQDPGDPAAVSPDGTATGGGDPADAGSDGPDGTESDGTGAPPPNRGTGGTSAVLVSATADQRAGVLEMSGYVLGVIEEGGACTYVLTRSAEVVEVRTTGVADAEVTSCPWGVVRLADLTSGTWTAQLVYEPTGATSPPVRVDVG